MSAVHIMNIHQFASSFASRNLHMPSFLMPNEGQHQPGSPEIAAHTDEAAALNHPLADPSDFSTPTQSELSPKNQALHAMLTKPFQPRISL